MHFLLRGGTRWGSEVKRRGQSKFKSSSLLSSLRTGKEDDYSKETRFSCQKRIIGRDRISGWTGCSFILTGRHSTLSSFKCAKMDSKGKLRQSGTDSTETYRTAPRCGFDFSILGIEPAARGCNGLSERREKAGNKSSLCEFTLLGDDKSQSLSPGWL